jgi:hypothetical protein
LAAIVLTAAALAIPAADLGWNQGAHLALVRALYSGTAQVDEYRWQTGDVSYFKGHYYSTKAPGLALGTLPVYAALRASGAENAIADAADSRRTTAERVIWVLGLWGVVLPAALTLLLVRFAGHRLEPGFGTVTALTLGLATLLLPFATLFFSHTLAATLGFAAFAVLLLERERSPSLPLVFAAGLIAGFGITTEYPVLLVAVALGVFALARDGPRLRRGLAFTAGAALGIMPLAVYNRLAFGSFTHLSYEHAVSRAGVTGHDELGANVEGLFGVRRPSPDVLRELLFESRGLLVVTPVLALSLYGLVLLYRRGKRAEALLIAFVAAAFLLLNAGYELPFGGWTAGPRFLVAALPFVAVPIALAYRRLPVTTSALAVASAAMVLTATITRPLLPDGDTAEWPRLLAAGDFRDNVLDIAGLGTAPGAMLFAVLVGLAIALAALVTPWPAVRRSDVLLAATSLLLWAIAANVLPRIGTAPGREAVYLVLCSAGLAAIAVSGAVLARTRRTTPQSLLEPVTEPTRPRGE